MLVPAEMLGVRSGLGYQILNVAVIGVLGFLLDWVAWQVLTPRRARA